MCHLVSKAASCAAGVPQPSGNPAWWMLLLEGKERTAWHFSVPATAGLDREQHWPWWIMLKFRKMRWNGRPVVFSTCTVDIHGRNMSFFTPLWNYVQLLQTVCSGVLCSEKAVVRVTVIVFSFHLEISLWQRLALKIWLSACFYLYLLNVRYGFWFR